MKDSSARMFFVSDDGNKKIKVSKSDLQAAIDSGKHSEKTLAWTIGMGPAWLRLSDPFWRKYGIIIRSDCHPRPPATNVPEKKKELERPSPVGGKTFKIYEHPYFKPKVIKLGFSWLAFFFQWGFFFYHKCFKAGTELFVGIAVFTFSVELLKSVLFYNNFLRDYEWAFGLSWLVHSFTTLFGLNAHPQ